MSPRGRKGENQKLKMLYLAKIFSEETDDQHGLTISGIQAKLAACGVNADRKTLYLDLEELRHFGMDIVVNKEGSRYFYALGERDFELSELKLLVDSVQSSRFLTDRKSQKLIKKLEGLVSRYEAGKLQRQVVLSGRVKTMNESIYYNVDKLHEAIGRGKQIRFKYYQWNVKKEMELRKNGEWYRVSPWALMWHNENYYLVAYDPADKKIKHYRVDKMIRITPADEDREGAEAFKAFDAASYAKSLFGMFGGEETRVTLEAENGLAGILIDRFGKDIPLVAIDPGHFRTVVSVAVSSQFLSWIMALGEGIRITSPDHVAARMREEAERLLRQYR
ncbi:MAG: WYL domain-containing protein [Lachnospiraceae bacterium]|nr:WYL domain-containing protein [Lachnospiraceae bacterium]